MADLTLKSVKSDFEEITLLSYGRGRHTAATTFSILSMQFKATPYLGHIKSHLFPVIARITFEQRIKKNYVFNFVDFYVFGTLPNRFRVRVD